MPPWSKGVDALSRGEALLLAPHSGVPSRHLLSYLSFFHNHDPRVSSSAQSSLTRDQEHWPCTPAGRYIVLSAVSGVAEDGIRGSSAEDSN